MDPPYREMLADTIAATPAGRWAQPEDVARLIAVLLSGDAPCLTGAAVVIDGGANII